MKLHIWSISKHRLCAFFGKCFKFVHTTQPQYTSIKLNRFSCVLNFDEMRNSPNYEYKLCLGLHINQNYMIVIYYAYYVYMILDNKTECVCVYVCVC